MTYLESQSLRQEQNAAPVILSMGRFQDRFEAPTSGYSKPIETKWTAIRILTFKAGEVILSRGEKITGIYFLKKGVVKVTSKCALVRGRTASDEYISKLVGEGEYFGYQDLILQKETFNHDAQALKECEVHVVPFENIDSKIQNQGNSIRSEVMHQMAKDQALAEENSKYHYLASVGERIAHLISTLGQRFGDKTSEGILIQLKLTRSELAQLAGTINESLSRHLSELKEAGLIEVRGKEIVIKNPEALYLKSGC